MPTFVELWSFAFSRITKQNLELCIEQLSLNSNHLRQTQKPRKLFFGMESPILVRLIELMLNC